MQVYNVYDATKIGEEILLYNFSPLLLPFSVDFNISAGHMTAHLRNYMNYFFGFSAILTFYLSIYVHSCSLPLLTYLTSAGICAALRIQTDWTY